MKHYFLLAGGLIFVLAVWMVPVRSVFAATHLILKTDGSVSASGHQVLVNAPAIDAELPGVFNGAISEDVVFPATEQLDSINLWLGLSENPVPTSFYIEVQQNGVVIATSTVATVINFDPLHAAETDFGFTGTDRIVVQANTPYRFFVRATGDGNSQSHLLVSTGVVNGEENSYAYYEIYGEDAGPTLGALAQILPNGSRLEAGAGMTSDTLTLQAQVWGSSPSDRVGLQVESEVSANALSGSVNTSSFGFDSGSVIPVVISGLDGGNYHWQARAIDASGRTSAWVPFGGANNIDFSVDRSPNTIAGYWSSGNFSNNDCDPGSAPVTPSVSFSLRSIDIFANCSNGSCVPPNDIRVYDTDGTTLLAESDQTNPFDTSQDSRVTQTFSGQNRIQLLAGHTYRVAPHSANGTCKVIPDDGVRDTFYMRGPQPATREPVVIVPGILGTALDRVADGGEVWPDVNKMIFSGSDDYLDDLKLAPDGSQIAGKEMSADAVIESESISVGGVNVFSQPFYGALVKAFTDRGYTLGTDLFEAPYDWRMDLASQDAALDRVFAAATAASPDAKINIVAHSMGALLVKEYLTGPRSLAFVDRVVLVGAPQLGTPIMFKAFNFGDNLGFTFPVVNSDVLSSAETKSMVQNMPGPYELLPSRRYIDINGGYIRDFRNGSSGALSYDDTTALMTADPDDSRNPALLQNADQFHAGLDTIPISGAEQVDNVIACDNPATVGEFHLYDDGKIDIASTNGDGTVPLTSAIADADSYNNYFISSRDTGIDHMGLVTDPRSVALIAALATGSAPDAALSPSGIGTSSAICFPPPASDAHGLTFRFSTHSPVALSMHDGFGNTTGPMADGTIQTKIPGSTYEKIGENSFVFLPADQNYDVIINGLASGTFNFKAEVLDGTTTVSQMNYLDVPVSGPSMVATISFSPVMLSAGGNGLILDGGSGNPPVLSVDQDGDTIPDLTLTPTAVLTGITAADITPPTVTVSGIPSTAVLGSSFTISFSAHDDLSGVGTVIANLDGAPFESGKTFTASDLGIGTHTVEVIATDNAGNPRDVKEVFTIAAASVAATQSCHVRS